MLKATRKPLVFYKDFKANNQQDGGRKPETTLVKSGLNRLRMTAFHAYVDNDAKNGK